MPRFDFTITGDIEADNEDIAQGMLEHALNTIDQNAEIDLTEQQEVEDEKELDE